MFSPPPVVRAGQKRGRPVKESLAAVALKDIANDNDDDNNNNKEEQKEKDVTDMETTNARASKRARVALTLPERAPELDATETTSLSATIRHKYRILEKIGEGAYGQVFRAETRDSAKRTQVAIKVTKPQEDDELLQNQTGHFVPATMMGLSVTTMGELSLLARLKHPNIIRMEEVVYDAQRHTLELVLELASTDLKQQIRAWWAPVTRETNPPSIVPARPTLEQVQHMVRIAYDVFCGLHYLHENGIIHLDIKPANVLLVQGRAKLADFGLSEREEGLRADGQGKVTWPYRSPELQCNLKRYDASADIWSVGVLLIDMFFNRHVFMRQAPGYTDTTDDPAFFRGVTRVVGRPSNTLIRAYREASVSRCGSMAAIAVTALPDSVDGAYLNLEDTLFEAGEAAFFQQLYTPARYRAMLDLVHACLRYEPADRITFREVQQHPLFINGGCDACACETVRGFHMPDNAHHLLPAAVERLVHQTHATPALIRYARELYKRLELADPPRLADARNIMACACVSIASKLLQIESLVDLHRSLVLQAGHTTLAAVQQLRPSAVRASKWKELADALHQYEGACGRILRWNFDGPWHATAENKEHDALDDREGDEEDDDTPSDRQRALLSLHTDELQHKADATYMAGQPDWTIDIREAIVDWLVTLHRHAKMSPRVLYLAVQVLDRYLAKQQVDAAEIELVSCATLLFASMREDTEAIEPHALGKLTANQFSRHALVTMESKLDEAGLDLVAPVILDFMRPFTRLAHVKPETEVWFLALYLAELSLQAYDMLVYPPSYVAAAAFYLAQNTVRAERAQPPAPVAYSLEQLTPTILKLYALAVANQRTDVRLVGVKGKYWQSRLGSVAKLIIRQPKLAV